MVPNVSQLKYVRVPVHAPVLRYYAAILLADTNVLNKYTARYLRVESELQSEDGMT
jgi:hypothetical protein